MISMKDGYLNQTNLWMVENATTSYSSASYSQVGYSKSMFNGYWNRLLQLIDREKCREPYLGLRLAEVGFKEPYLRCADFDVIALAVMRLLMKYIYNTTFSDGKFTIVYKLKMPKRKGDVSFTIGNAISLKDSCGNAVPNMDVYAMIFKIIIAKAEDYDKEVLSGVGIRVYLNGELLPIEKELPLCSDEEIYSKMWQLMEAGIGGGSPPEVKAMDRNKRRYPDHVPALKPTSKVRKGGLSL